MFDALVHLELFTDAPARDAWLHANAQHQLAWVGKHPSHDLAYHFDHNYKVIRGFGLHPATIARVDAEHELRILTQLCQSGAAQFVGECGIDSRAGMPKLSTQTIVFNRQLSIAAQHQLPVIMHVVRATQAALRCIDATDSADDTRIWHAFAGPRELLDALAKRRILMGIGGLALSTRALKLQAALPHLPRDLFVLESDAPHGAADTTTRVAQHLATLWRLDVGEVIALATANAQRAFLCRAESIACAP